MRITTNCRTDHGAGDLGLVLGLAGTYRAAFQAGQASAHAIGRVAWALGNLHLVELPETLGALVRAYDHVRARLGADDHELLAVLASARTILSDYLALRQDTKAYRARQSAGSDTAADDGLVDGK